MHPEGAETGPDSDTRLSFETLLADLSSRFINLAPDHVDREIEDALRRVCERLGIEFAVLWQWSTAAPGVVVPTHAYDVHRSYRPTDPLSQEHYPWVVQQMKAGRLVCFSRLEELPPEAAVDRDSARATGITSNLTLPLAIGGKPPVGAIALSTLEHERDWPAPLITRLQLVAQVFTNAIARQRSDEALRTSQARLQAGADLADLAFYEADFAAGTMFVDARLSSMCGIPPDRMQGLGPLEFWTEHLHPDDRQRVLDSREQMQAGALDRVSTEYRYLHPTRGERWIHHARRAAARDSAGRVTHSFGVMRDITDRRRGEEELRSLSRRLIRAQEDERALLARELHDDVTQRLAVMAIEAGRAEMADRGGAQTKALTAIRENLVRLSEDIHALAYQLHPSVLEELGLAEALHAECERRARQGHVALTPDLQPVDAGVVGKDTALCLYRVAQEALNNVIRHAHASSATVVLRQMDGGLLLAVRDNGAGFDPGGAKPGRSLGLASMRERVRLANGTLDIESAPGRGTAVVAWVPGDGEPS